MKGGDESNGKIVIERSFGKGIPMGGKAGWKLSVINLTGGTLTTGQLVSGTFEYQGVWLKSF